MEEEKEEEKRCEECNSDESLIDAILDGALAKLCRKCAQINGAVVIEKPSIEQLASIKKPTMESAAERIARIPGLSKELHKSMRDITPDEITISDLRKLQEKKEKKEGS